MYKKIEKLVIIETDETTEKLSGYKVFVYMNTKVWIFGIRIFQKQKLISDVKGIIKSIKKIGY